MSTTVVSQHSLLKAVSLLDVGDQIVGIDGAIYLVDALGWDGSVLVYVKGLRDPVSKQLDDVVEILVG